MAGIVGQLKETLTLENASGALAGGLVGAITIPLFLTGFEGGGISIPGAGDIPLDPWQMGALIGAGAKLIVDQVNFTVLQKGQAGQLDQLDSMLVHSLGTAIAFVIVPMLMKKGVTPSAAAIQKLMPAGVVSGIAAHLVSEKLADSA